MLKMQLGLVYIYHPASGASPAHRPRADMAKKRGNGAKHPHMAVKICERLPGFLPPLRRSQPYTTTILRSWGGSEPIVSTRFKQAAHRG